jgi:hypothetical protein
MKMSGIKEKVTMVKKEEEFNQHPTSAGMHKQDMPNQSIQLKLSISYCFLVNGAYWE